MSRIGKLGRKKMELMYALLVIAFASALLGLGTACYVKGQPPSLYNDLVGITTFSFSFFVLTDLCRRCTRLHVSFYLIDFVIAIVFSVIATNWISGFFGFYPDGFWDDPQFGLRYSVFLLVFFGIQLVGFGLRMKLIHKVK